MMLKKSKKIYKIVHQSKISWDFSNISWDDTNTSEMHRNTHFVSDVVM